MFKHTVFFLFNIFTFLSFGNGEKRFTILNLNGMCPNYKSLPIVNSVLQVGNVNGKLSMNATLNVKENIKGPIKSVMKVEVCEKNNKCTTMLNTKSNKYCEDVNSLTSPIGVLARSLTPPYKCPIHKGSYKILNKELDLRYLSMLGLRTGTFKTITQLYDIPSNKLLNCLSVEATYA